MFELEYLYEQLKTQVTESMYIDVLNSVVIEGCYDNIEADKNVLETMYMIEEAAGKGRYNLIKRLKTNISSAEKVLAANKDAALKCNPIGLTYKKYMEFMSDDEIKSLHKKMINYLNKFDPSKASEEQCKEYIKDSSNNVQYKEISKIFGNGKERYKLQDVFITKEFDKDITKDDISKAVKYLQICETELKKIQNDMIQNDKEYTEFVRKDGLMTANTKGDINKLRKQAFGHKRALIAIADSTYYQAMILKKRFEIDQAKHIVAKAAHYNPKNLKESAVIQLYIDSLYELND